eukprot:12860189-Alexandrium_andersonii.AAC.1
MSASLVGSEMCIRDRSLFGAQRKRPGVHQPRGAIPASRLHPDPAWGLAPVSYTHLTLPTICSV